MPETPTNSQPELDPAGSDTLVPEVENHSALLTDVELKTIRVRLKALAEELPCSSTKLAQKEFTVLTKRISPTAVSRREAAEAVGGEDALDILLAQATWPMLPKGVDLTRYRLVRHRYFHRQNEHRAWESIGARQDMERHLKGQGCSPRKPPGLCALSQVDTALELIARKYAVATLPETGFLSSPGADAAQDWPLEVYFCHADKKYYWQSDRSRQWEPLDRRAFEDVAGDRKISSRIPEGSDVSPFTRLISRIHAERTVHFVDELSGYPAGVHEVKVDASSVMRVLCPRGVRLPAAQPGEFPTIRRVLDAVLNHDEHGAAQIETVHLFIAEARQAIACQERTRQAPALGMIGLAGSGKSLLQNAVVAPLLGGRTALAYPYLVGRTDKNGDMSKVEILQCEDSSIRHTFEERSAFGQAIKEIVGNQMQRIRAMYREATAQQPIWRMIITANSESGYYRILPPLDPTLEGKLSLLYAASAAQTKELISELGGPTALAALIAQELPAYAHFVDAYAVPEERRDGRHYYRAFVHPFLRDLLQEERPELALLELMHSQLFTGPDDGEWKGSATEIHHKLSANPGVWDGRGGVGRTFEKLVGRNAISLGRMLTDLAENSDGAVTSKQLRNGGTPRRVYVIQPPSAKRWVALRHLHSEADDFESGRTVDLRDLDHDELLRDDPGVSKAGPQRRRR